MGRLHALLVLAWALLRSTLAPILGRRRGLPEFRRSYGARLPVVAPDERAGFERFSRCIACGLCDVGEGERIARSGGRYRGVMDLMLSSSRGIPDFDAAAASLALVGDDRLAELEARCPTRVPMRALAALVRAKAGALSPAGDESPPGP